MKRDAARACSGCGLYLPRQRRQYAELRGGWAIEHEGGGAHGIHSPEWTGRVLCELCFVKQRPRVIARPTLRPLCDDCQDAPVRLRQLAHAWTRLPKANEVLDAHYSALALCQKCWEIRMQGEQMSLFDA